MGESDATRESVIAEGKSFLEKGPEWLHFKRADAVNFVTDLDKGLTTEVQAINLNREAAERISEYIKMMVFMLEEKFEKEDIPKVIECPACEAKGWLPLEDYPQVGEVCPLCNGEKITVEKKDD